ncbi:hypothetical protein [Actinophytocola sp.]|jgi:hypothetical protein|uniref:hypothetical protein n=1 Tax=Actinophytocola sp. TaxID=1872138 RepID=UPI002ED7D9C8
MTTTTREILSSLFFNGAEASSHGNISIDVLDSWTNGGIAAVAPTTISWCDGRSPASDVHVAS